MRMNKKIYAVIGLLFWVGSACVPAPVVKPPTVSELYGQGLAYLRAGQYEQAIDYFTKACDIDPRNQYILLHRGQAYAAIGDFEHAEYDFNRVLKLNPKNPRAYYLRGLVYRDKKRFNLAYGDFQKAIELNPRYAQAYYQSGLLKEKKKLFRDALTDYKKFLEYAGPEDNKEKAVAEEKVAYLKKKLKRRIIKPPKPIKGENGKTKITGPNIIKPPSEELKF